MAALQGARYAYDLIRSVSALEPQAQYDAWATQLGVSNTGTDLALDGDDVGFVVPLLHTALPEGDSSVLFSSEGGFGLYRQGAVLGSQTFYSNLTGVTRMFGPPVRPDILFTFHPQIDCRSESVKIRKTSAASIFHGIIRYFVGASPYLEFAIRVDATGTRIVIGATDADVAFKAFLEIQTTPEFDSVVSPGGPVLFTMTAQRSADVAIGVRLTGETIGVGSLAYLGPPTVRIADKPRSPPGDFQIGQRGKSIGRLRGTIHEKGVVTNPAVVRRVRLYRERDGLLIREQWSAPVTGAYDFQNIDELETYTVITFDHTHNFGPAANDNLTLANGVIELMS